MALVVATGEVGSNYVVELRAPKPGARSSCRNPRNHIQSTTQPSPSHIRDSRVKRLQSEKCTLNSLSR
jgi:hypothetical protein